MKRMFDDKEINSLAKKDYVDNSISALYGDFYTKDQADARFPTETHMNLLLGYKQDRLTAGTNITIDENNVISATGGGSSYTAGNGININNDEISVDTNTIATVATLQSFTQSFGGEINAIYSGTSTVGKARQDALGRTIDEYYASKTEAKPTTYILALGSSSTKFFYATITAEAGLENTYGPDDFWTFITKYARYVNWYYENDNDSTDNHKSCVITTPGQTLGFYLADGTAKATAIPVTQVYLVVTKTN